MIDLKKKYWIILGGFALLTIGGLLFTLRRKKAVGSNSKSSKSTDASSSFKTKLVDLANSEWDKWNKGGVRIKEGSQDTIQDLRDYWEKGAGVKKNDTYYINEAWSSAFISYLMKMAGAGDDFKYSQSHSQYIAQAVKNRKENNDKKFKAYKPNEVDVKVGDLVCYPRQSGVTYDSGAGYKSHCDLIISINGDVAVGVGGNVSNSVSKKNYALSNGKIDKTKNKDIFTVIKNEK
jgi:hypothetical protein